MYYKPKCFPHFLYISKLARKLKSEVEEATRSVISETALRTDIIIKITFFGEVAEKDIKLVTKKNGKNNNVYGHV